MIPQAKLNEVQAALDAGLHSLRAIAQMTGVNRQTIAQIASGDYAKRMSNRRAARRSEAALGSRTRSPWRCPDCGHLIVTDECIECTNLRAMKRKRRVVA
jgi:hypothetical protein